MSTNNILLPNGANVPKHSVGEIDRYQNNGFMMPRIGYYVLTGSVSVSGGTTDIVEEVIDSYGFELKRIEVFHSGAASYFDFSIKNISGSTDPLAVIADYANIAGSDDYSGGIDQVESLVGVASNNASLYLYFSPNLTGNNDFKYLIFVQPAVIFINRDSTL